MVTLTARARADDCLFMTRDAIEAEVSRNETEFARLEKTSGVFDWLAAHESCRREIRSQLRTRFETMRTTILPKLQFPVPAEQCNLLVEIEDRTIAWLGAYRQARTTSVFGRSPDVCDGLGLKVEHRDPCTKQLYYPPISIAQQTVIETVQEAANTASNAPPKDGHPAAPPPPSKAPRKPDARPAAGGGRTTPQKPAAAPTPAPQKPGGSGQASNSCFDPTRGTWTDCTPQPPAQAPATSSGGNTPYSGPNGTGITLGGGAPGTGDGPGAGPGGGNGPGGPGDDSGRYGRIGNVRIGLSSGGDPTGMRAILSKEDAEAKGITRGGAVISAAREATSKLGDGPTEGNVTFTVTVDNTGRIVSVTGGGAEWDEVRKHLLALLNAKPTMRVPWDSKGMVVTISLEAAMRLPSGAKQGHAITPEIGPLSVGVRFDLSDIGSRASRQVRTTDYSEKVLY